MLSSANLLQTIFDRSPRLVKRAMINLEAIRRDRFRRYGDYAAELRFYDPAWYASASELQETFQLQRLNDLLHSAKTHVPWKARSYRQRPILLKYGWYPPISLTLSRWAWCWTPHNGFWGFQ